MHGREAYRRNSFLISFMFYKNIIFVIPIVCLGYFSFFSGIALYNDLLYQCFNLFFTSWPIIIFSIFDFQYDKAELLRDPRHYRIGFKSKDLTLLLYNKNRWIIWQSYLYIMGHHCCLLWCLILCNQRLSYQSSKPIRLRPRINWCWWTVSLSCGCDVRQQ